MKMKFNIITLLIICFFFNKSLSFSRHSSPDATIIANDNIRFLQKSISSEDENKEKNKQNLKYNADIYIVSETDLESDKPQEQSSIIMLDKSGINIVDNRNKLSSTTSYLR